MRKANLFSRLGLALTVASTCGLGCISTAHNQQVAKEVAARRAAKGVIPADAVASTFMAGQRHERNGELQKARADYEAVLRRNPQNSAVLERLAALHVQNKEFAAADALYTQALALKPHDTRLLCDAAMNKHVLGQTQVAEMMLAESHLRHPQDLRVANNLAIVIGSSGRKDETLRVLGSVHNEVDAQIFLGHIERARGDLASARDCYQKARVADPLNQIAVSSLQQLDTLSQVELAEKRALEVAEGSVATLAAIPLSTGENAVAVAGGNSIEFQLPAPESVAMTESVPVEESDSASEQTAPIDNLVDGELLPTMTGIVVEDAAGPNVLSVSIQPAGELPIPQGEGQFQEPETTPETAVVTSPQTGPIEENLADEFDQMLADDEGVPPAAATTVDSTTASPDAASETPEQEMATLSAPVQPEANWAVASDLAAPCPISPVFGDRCPVSLREERLMLTGRPEFFSDHGGWRYHFASAGAKVSFDADPEYYAPAFGGKDIVLARETIQQASAEGVGTSERMGTLDHAIWFRDELYVFASNQTKVAFKTQPSKYVGPKLPLPE
jgi:tetratricopeptide (TPR) repeat protein/YHS domain-containing protein